MKDQKNILLKKRKDLNVPSKELKNIILKLLENKSELEKKKEKARQIIKENTGATKIIWNEIQKLW